MALGDAVSRFGVHRENGVGFQGGNEPVQLAEKPRAAADFPRAEGDFALEPDDAQAIAAAAAEEVVQLIRVGELRRGCGSEDDIAAGGGEAFG